MFLRWSSNLPGVAITISGVWICNCWDSCVKEWFVESVIAYKLVPREVNTWKTWVVRSVVGTMMRHRIRGTIRLDKVCVMGNKYARVLPEPVGAVTIKSASGCSLSASNVRSWTGNKFSIEGIFVNSLVINFILLISKKIKQNDDHFCNTYSTPSFPSSTGFGRDILESFWTATTTSIAFLNCFRASNALDTIGSKSTLSVSDSLDDVAESSRTPLIQECSRAWGAVIRWLGSTTNSLLTKSLATIETWFHSSLANEYRALRTFWVSTRGSSWSNGVYPQRRKYVRTPIDHKSICSL